MLCKYLYSLRNSLLNYLCMKILLKLYMRLSASNNIALVLKENSISLPEQLIDAKL